MSIAFAQGVAVVQAGLQSASQGFWAGGAPPFGYERWAIAPDGQRMKLASGERRYIYSWRTKLEPGPPDEVAVVRRIFRLYLVHGFGLQEIANDLNARGSRRRNGDLWYGNCVRNVLMNPIYGGEFVYGRVTQSMKGPTRPTSPSSWIRVAGAFPAIVSQKAIDKAQAELFIRRRRAKFSDDQLISLLVRTLKREGRLSNSLVNNDKTIPSTNYYRQRFGSMENAFRLAGYAPPGRSDRIIRIRRITQLRTSLTGMLRLSLASCGVNTKPLGSRWFDIGGLRSTCLPMLPSSHKGYEYWRAHVPERRHDLIVLARLNEDDSPIDYRIVRRRDVRQGHLFLTERLLEVSTQHASLDDAAERLIVLSGSEQMWPQ